MNLYLLLVTLSIVNAEVIPDTKCNGVIIDGHYYEKEVLKTGLSVPFNLAVDHNTNIIYFTHHIGAKMSNTKSALFDLNTKEFKDNNDVPSGYTHAVDRNTRDVYIGGTYYIYKYDHKHHKSELYAAHKKPIYSLFIKDILYFADHPSMFMYTYIDGNITRFKDMEDTKAHYFVIDNKDIMFYSNATGLFAQKKGDKNAVLYSKKNVNALTLDVHGNAYMCTEHAIHKIDKMSMSLNKLVDVNTICRGLAFDKENNFIHSDDNSLVRFKRIRKTC